MCAFYSMKSVDYGIARRDSHEDLVGTVGDIFLPQSYTYVPPPLNSCVLLTINIRKDIWCELILKHNQNEKITRSFCQLNLLLKTDGACPMQEKKCANPYTLEQFLKNVVHTPDMQRHLIRLCIEYTNALNPQQVTTVNCSDQPIDALYKIIQWKYSEFAENKRTASSRNTARENSR